MKSIMNLMLFFYTKFMADLSKVKAVNTCLVSGVIALLASISLLAILSKFNYNKVSMVIMLFVYMFIMMSSLVVLLTTTSLGGFVYNSESKSEVTEKTLKKGLQLKSNQIVLSSKEIEMEYALESSNKSSKEEVEGDILKFSEWCKVSAIDLKSGVKVDLIGGMTSFNGGAFYHSFKLLEKKPSYFSSIGVSKKTLLEVLDTVVKTTVEEISNGNLDWSVEGFNSGLLGGSSVVNSSFIKYELKVLLSQKVISTILEEVVFEEEFLSLKDKDNSVLGVINNMKTKVVSPFNSLLHGGSHHKVSEAEMFNILEKSVGDSDASFLNMAIKLTGKDQHHFKDSVMFGSLPHLDHGMNLSSLPQIDPLANTFLELYYSKYDKFVIEECGKEWNLLYYSYQGNWMMFHMGEEGAVDESLHKKCTGYLSEELDMSILFCSSPVVISGCSLGDEDGTLFLGHKLFFVEDGNGVYSVSVNTKLNFKIGDDLKYLELNSSSINATFLSNYEDTYNSGCGCLTVEEAKEEFFYKSSKSMESFYCLSGNFINYKGYSSSHAEITAYLCGSPNDVEFIQECVNISLLNMQEVSGNYQDMVKDMSGFECSGYVDKVEFGMGLGIFVGTGHVGEGSSPGMFVKFEV